MKSVKWLVCQHGSDSVHDAVVCFASRFLCRNTNRCGNDWANDSFIHSIQGNWFSDDLERKNKMPFQHFHVHKLFWNLSITESDLSRFINLILFARIITCSLICSLLISVDCRANSKLTTEEHSTASLQDYFVMLQYKFMKKTTKK